MYERLDALDSAGVDPTTGRALPTASIPGDGVRRAAMHEVAGPVMRILVELEALEPNGGWKAGGWADRVLCGLVSEVASGEVGTANTAATSDLREEYLAGLLRHPASSPTFEMLLTLAPKPVFDALWSTFFAQKLHRLAANAVANFVVAVGVARVDEKQLDALVQELRGIAEERRGEWIDNYRTGVLRALMESASRLGASEAEVSEVRLFHSSPRELGLLTLSLLAHARHVWLADGGGAQARRALRAQPQPPDGAFLLPRPPFFSD